MKSTTQADCRGVRRLPPALRRTGIAAALVIAQAVPALAQEAPPEMKGSRRFVFALAGAALAALPAYFADDATGEGGLCESRTCMTGLGAGMGGAVGFLIGRERDRAAGRRAAFGPSVDFSSRTVELSITPEALKANGGGVAVLGRDGVQALTAEGQLIPTGGELRGVSSALALPARRALLAGTSSGLFAFPLAAVEGEGRLVLSESASSLEPIAGEELLVAGGSLLRRLRLTGESAMLSLAEEARSTLPGPASAVVYAPYSGVIWSLSGERLTARAAVGLEQVGELVLPAAGRALAVDRGRAIIAGGAEGAFIADLERPAAPRLLGRVVGFGFVHDAVLDGSRAYIAAGPNGLLVLDVADPASPALLGTMRNLGFVSGVERGEGGTLYVIDRAGGRLLIIETAGATIE